MTAVVFFHQAPFRPVVGGRLAGVVAGAIVIAGALLNTAVGVLSLVAPSVVLAAVGQGGQELSPATLVFAGYAGARELGIGLLLLGQVDCDRGPGQTELLTCGVIRAAERATNASRAR